MSEFKKIDYKEDLERVNAIIKTNNGEIEVELYAKECPETVWNFINLAEGRQPTEKGENVPFYNGIIFHRVIEGFMLQVGCPLGAGYGGPGYKFGDEFVDSLTHSEAGTLSMANAGPGTNGSQFFITLAPTPHLNGAHTVFGKVVRGMECVKMIGSVGTDHSDKPLEDVIIEDVTIVR